jgi:hypothetical protein
MGRSIKALSDTVIIAIFVKHVPMVYFEKLEKGQPVRENKYWRV